MNNNYTETGVASRGISLFGRTSRTLHCHARRRPYASLFRLKYYKWWEALWVPNRLVVPLMKGTGCSGKTRNTQGWLMIAPCSSGVIRDQKQRENRIETNDFFPPACCLLPACLMYFFCMHGFCCTFPNCIEKMCEHTTRLIDGLLFMHTTTLLHSTQCSAMFCPKNVYVHMALWKQTNKKEILSTSKFTTRLPNCFVLKILNG